MQLNSERALTQASSIATRSRPGWLSPLSRWGRPAALSGFPVIPGVVIFLFLIAALLGDRLAPYPPNVGDLGATFQPPFFDAAGSMAHPFGTDMLGRDLLSRILVGARPSLIVALLVIVIAGFGGTAIGIISGYYGGTVDAVLMRITDSVIAFPIVLVAMLLAVSIGPSLENVVFGISVILWSRFARVIRGEVLSLRERGYVALARVAGASGPQIMIHHIFPNVTHTMLVLLTLQIGFVIIIEATLSFLGAGIPAPTPAWGRLISDGSQYITTAWWISTFPGLILAAICLSFNMLGDWLREILDPKLRQL